MMETVCFCGIPTRGHPGCRGCAILVGPYHHDLNTEGGLCGTCHSRATLEQARVPTPGELALRRKRREALVIYEAQGIRAVQRQFHISGKTAAKWFAWARRDRLGVGA